MSSTSFSTRNKVGLVLALLLGLADIPNLFTSIDTGDNAGPPQSINILDGICGIVTVVAVIWAWRALNRGAVRLAAGARILSMVSALPAFFVDVPAAVKVFVAVFVILTFVTVALMLSPARETSPVAETAGV